MKSSGTFSFLGRLITFSLHVRRAPKAHSRVDFAPKDSDETRLIVTVPENPLNPFYTAFSNQLAKGFQISHQPDLDHLISKLPTESPPTILLHQLEPHIKRLPQEVRQPSTLIRKLDRLATAKVPILYVWHNKQSHSREYREFVRVVESWLFRSGKVGLITLSSEAREALLRKGVEEWRVMTLYHPSVGGFHGPIEEMKIARKRLELPEQGKIFSILGAQRESKTLGVSSVDAIQATLERMGDWLLVAGQGARSLLTPEKNSKILVRDNSLSSFEYGSYLNATDYVVVPSQPSVWVSTSVLSALAYATPVIIPTTLHMSDYLLDAENCLIYDPSDSNSLADTMAKASKLEDLYPHFVVNAAKASRSDSSRDLRRLKLLTERITHYGS